MKIYLARDLKNQNVYWENIEHKNSLAITGLSGNGKSFLVGHILNCFLKQNYKVIVISDKAKVDYKNKSIERINTLEDTDKIEEFIGQTHALIRRLKLEVEQSEFSHVKSIGKQANLLIILDELWSFNKMEKDLKKRFVDLIELIIRQGRFLSIYLVMATQISRVSESEIPLRQASLLIVGKTDTAEISTSILGDDRAYKTPLKTGMFFFWDRANHPKLIRILPEKLSILRRLLKWLK